MFPKALLTLLIAPLALLAEQFDSDRYNACIQQVLNLPTGSFGPNSSWQGKTCHLYEITIKRPLGHGSQGQVVAAVMRGQDVAVKIVSLLQTSRKSLAREECFLSSVSHLIVPKMYCSIRIGTMVYLVMELIKGNDAIAYIKNKGRLPIVPWLKVFREALNFLSFIHSHGFVYRDLKLDHMMFESDTDRLRLIDFGSITAASSSCQPIRGTLNYLPPEIAALQLKKVSSAPVSPKLDWYGLGLCMAMLLEGNFSGFFFEKPQDWLLVAIAQGIDPKRLPNNPFIRHLLIGMTLKKPRDRWGEMEIREWLKQHEDKYICSNTPDMLNPKDYKKYLITRTVSVAEAPTDSRLVLTIIISSLSIIFVLLHQYGYSM